MGADFLLIALPQIDDKAADRLRAEVNNASLRRLNGVFLDVQGCALSEAGEDTSALEELRTELLAAIDILVGDGNDYERELDYRRIEGKDYVFTGGMSWGDEPTDAFRILNAWACWQYARREKEELLPDPVEPCHPFREDFEEMVEYIQCSTCGNFYEKEQQ